jgi:ABC-type transport system involved in multi-copper enzyme maturation permease subunit
MKNLIKGEFFKLKKSKGVKAAILLVLIASIALCGYIELCKKLKPGDHIEAEGIAILFQLLSAIVYVNFLSFIMAVVLIVMDFEKQTINMTFTYGYSRFQILLAKFIIYSIGVVILEGIFIGALTLWCTILYGFGEKLNIIGTIHILKFILIDILCSIAIASITFIISIVTRSVILAIISPIAVLLLYSISVNIPIICNLLPINLLRKFYENSGSSTDAILFIISSILAIIISIVLSNLYLRKKEFK